MRATSLLPTLLSSLDKAVRNAGYKREREREGGGGGGD